MRSESLWMENRCSIVHENQHWVDIRGSQDGLHAVRSGAYLGVLLKSIAIPLCGKVRVEEYHGVSSLDQRGEQRLSACPLAQEINWGPGALTFASYGGLSVRVCAFLAGLLIWEVGPGR